MAAISASRRLERETFMRLGTKSRGLSENSTHSESDTFSDKNLTLSDKIESMLFNV